MKEIKPLVQILKQTPGLARWKIAQQHIRRQNVYLTKNQSVESDLSSERDDILVTVYVKHGTSLGDSTFPVVSFDREQVRSQISDAKTACAYAKKPMYTLPGPQSVPKISLADPQIEKLYQQGKLRSKLHAMVRTLFSSFKKYPVVVNGMEIFSELKDTRIVNSAGLSMHQNETEVYLESVITARKGRHEQEFLPSKSYRTLKQFQPHAFVKHYTTLAHDVLHAIHPKHHQGGVVLSGDAVPDFFNPHLSLNPLIAHCSGKLHHLHLSRFGMKQKIVDNIQGDPLTIRTNPFVAYDTHTHAFDEDGVPARSFDLIRDHTFMNYLTSQRYADYLGIPPSGPLGMLELPPGKRSVADLFAGTVYEIVSFSSFVPNAFSGDFAAEVRLGYIHCNGKKQPFRGGLFTGNVFDLMRHVQFSKACMQEGGYRGPAYVKFVDGTIG